MPLRVGRVGRMPGLHGQARVKTASPIYAGTHLGCCVGSTRTKILPTYVCVHFS